MGQKNWKDELPYTERGKTMKELGLGVWTCIRSVKDFKISQRKYRGNSWKSVSEAQGRGRLQVYIWEPLAYRRHCRALRPDVGTMWVRVDKGKQSETQGLNTVAFGHLEQMRRNLQIQISTRKIKRVSCPGSHVKRAFWEGQVTV